MTVHPTRAASPEATLDTCVLLPITLCDTLLRFAEAGLFRPHWSQETLDELARNLVSSFAVSAEAAQRRVNFMRSAFPEALVSGNQHLIPSLTNAPKDRHVLAAAIRSGSQVIVTSNLKDFPAEALAEFDIEAQPPDLFLLHQANVDPRESIAIVRRQASEKTRPPRTAMEVLDRLAINAPVFAATMRILQGARESRPPTLPPGMDILEAEIQAAKLRSEHGDEHALD